MPSTLILLADLKAFIHMGEVHDDVLLQSIIDGTQAEIEQRIGQSLEQDIVIDEPHDGDRSNTILLDNGCVTAVAYVKIDDVELDADDYEWYPIGEIIRYNGYFYKSLKNIKVKYTHGYTAVTLPADLKLAMLKAMSNAYHGTLVIQEIEGSPKIYSQREIDLVIGKYVRLL
jgi:hypothetical protein